MKERTGWFSHRLNQEVAVARWGHFGMPVLIFPTAGGDAEEIERFHIIATLAPYLEQGRMFPDRPWDRYGTGPVVYRHPVMFEEEMFDRNAEVMIEGYSAGRILKLRGAE